MTNLDAELISTIPPWLTWFVETFDRWPLTSPYTLVILISLQLIVSIYGTIRYFTKHRAVPKRIIIAFILQIIAIILIAVPFFLVEPA